MKFQTNAVIEADNLTVEGIKIGGKTHELKIMPLSLHGVLDICFKEAKSDGFYKIHIDERGISFEREVLRPGHDHSDVQRLCVKDGVPQWVNTNYDHKCPTFRLAFGAVVEGE